MSKITSTAVAKVAAVATTLAMATSLLSFAPMVHAQTTTTTTTSTSCSVGTVNLTIGSSGMAVTCLQQGLIAAGYSIPAGATGYFGAQTRAAVSAWQAARGIMPTAGYFGAISRAAWGMGGSTTTTTTSTVPGCVAGAMFSSTTGAACTTTSTVPGCTAGAMFSSTTGAACSSTTTTTTTSGPLAGTDGSISDVSKLGSFNNEDVAEGNSGVKVLGADIETSNDGDIELKSIKVSFDPTGNTGSDNLDDYLDTVDVWLGSTKIGSADVAGFSQDSNNLYTKTITLNNAVIRADQVAKLYVSVDAVNNIDSSDISGDSWTVDIENIRFVDGSGVTTTDDSTGDINAMNVGISFVDFSTSANTELKLSVSSDSPKAGIVVIDDTSNTDNVSLLKGKMKLDGTSDVNLDEFPVTFTTVGGNGLSAVTGSVTLKLDGQTYTESVSTTTLVASITFDNLNFDINAGDTVDFEVLADINDIDAGNLDEGDTLLASVTSSNRDSMNVENAQNNQVSDSDKTGTVTGEAQEFRTNGISLTYVSSSQSATAGNSASDDLGTFTIKFKVTAIGDTAYVSSLADATLSGVTTGKTSVHVDRAGTATVGGTSVTISNNGTGSDSTTLNAAGLWTISEGSSQTFTVTTTVQLPTAGSAGQFRAVLGGVSWDTDSADATPDNTYTSNLTQFMTDYLGLN
ncbi:MAG: hypothetical protein JWN18_665 [Parcubacteria group bacterium]|nr:hypothetical protein [Parcubacteria group bacterium]